MSLENLVTSRSRASKLQQVVLPWFKLHFPLYSYYYDVVIVVNVVIDLPECFSFCSNNIIIINLYNAAKYFINVIKPRNLGNVQFTVDKTKLNSSWYLQTAQVCQYFHGYFIMT